MSSQDETRGAASQDSPPMQKMCLYLTCPPISNQSSMSEDLVSCLEPWVQLECRRTLCMDSGPCHAVKNRLRFFLIARIRRALLRRPYAKGFLPLLFPGSVHRRCISGIEWNTRYELIWVGVLRDSHAVIPIMKLR